MIDLETIFESVQEGISVLSVDLEIVRVNKKMEEWYSQNLPLVGKKCYEAYHNRDIPCEVCPSIRALKSKKPEKNIVPGLPGSQVVYIELFSFPIIKEDKSKVTGVVQFVRDVTKRVQTQQALRESEEKYRFITRNAKDVILVVDENGLITYTNDAIQKILGYMPGEIISSNLNELIEPEHKKRIIRFLNEVLDQNKSRSEFKFISKSESHPWLELNGKCIKVKEGIDTIVFVLRDVTKRKEMEKLKDLENQKLKELENLRKNFIATATHELKTPIQTISGATYLLKNKSSTMKDNNLVQLIDIVDRGIIRLTQLVNNLLDVSRLDTGTLVINPVKNNLVKIIDDVIKDMAYLANERNIEIITENINGDLIVYVDKMRIEEVILNLISNAIKNSFEGGKVRIDATKNDEGIVVSVKDNGIGITNEEKDLLFKQFGKIEREGMNADIQYGGQGLGLFIVKNILDMHGGRIWVESEGRNQGACFSFLLPK